MIVLALILIAVLCVVVFGYFSRGANKKDDGLKLVSSVSYLCDGKKTIKADYYNGPVISAKAGEMPIPSGKVNLDLNDGRKMSLNQTISASGIRYATDDEKIVFWSKGEGAFMTENDKETFSNCIQK